MREETNHLNYRNHLDLIICFRNLSVKLVVALSYVIPLSESLTQNMIGMG